MSPGKAVVALPVALLLCSACGDGSSDEDPGLAAEPGTSLTVEAHDIDFDRDVYRVTAGSVDIGYVQEGALPHSLAIEAPGGDDVDGFRLEVGGADEDSGAVDLPAGDYVIYCDVPGHRDAGMEAELRAE